MLYGCGWDMLSEWLLRTAYKETILTQQNSHVHMAVLSGECRLCQCMYYVGRLCVLAPAEVASVSFGKTCSVNYHRKEGRTGGREGLLSISCGFLVVLVRIRKKALLLIAGVVFL